MVRPILPPVIPIRPIQTETIVLEFAVKVLSCAAILSVFVLAVWIVLKKTKNELNEPKTVPALLSFTGVGLILLLLFGTTITAIKGLILCAILLWASISDICKHEVPDFITVLILVLAFVGFEPVNLPSMLVGAAVVFLPQLAVSMLRPGRAVGGADIKISTALAFLLGAEKGIFALIAGMLTGVIVMFIVRKIRKETNKEPFALVPFLSFGAMLAFMI